MIWSYSVFMVFGLNPLKSLFSLFDPDVSGLRDAKDDPRVLLARAGRRALRSERDLAISTFGFEDTIMAPKDASEIAAQTKKPIKSRKRNTLL